MPDGRPENEVIPAEVAETLNKVKKDFHDLEGAIREQKKYLTDLTLEEVRPSSVEFDHLQEVMKEFTGWLRTVEDSLDRARPYSCEVLRLKEDEIAHLAIRTDVRYHQPTYEYIDKDAYKFLKNEPESPTRREIEDSYNDIKPRWEDIKRRVNERHEQLDQILPLTRKFHDALQNVDGVVNRGETQLRALDGVPLSSEKCKQELPNIKGVLLVLGRRKRDVDRMNKIAQELAEKLKEMNGETEDLKQLQETANERYEKVKRELESKREDIENDNIGRFFKALESMSDEIKKVDEQISDEPLGKDPVKLKKKMDELKALQMELYQLKPKLGSLQHAGSALIQKNSSDEKLVKDITNKVQAVTNEYVTVEDKLRDKMVDFQSAVYKQQDFDKTVEDFEKWLTLTEEKVRSQMMLSIRPVVIKRQNKEQQVRME